MATASTSPASLTDFLNAEALAPEGTSLALIDGEIVEWGTNLTTRGPIHSRTVSRLAFLLWSWFQAHPRLAGGIDAGEVRCRLTRNPEKIVGIDIGVWLGVEFIEPPANPPLYDAPPALAIEVLSPSDKNESIWEKVHTYLDANVPLVWIVDPELKTITIHRPDAEPVMFNIEQTIPEDPALPGLTLPVAEVFRSKPLRLT